MLRADSNSINTTESSTHGLRSSVSHHFHGLSFQDSLGCVCRLVLGPKRRVQAVLSSSMISSFAIGLSSSLRTLCVLCVCVWVRVCFSLEVSTALPSRQPRVSLFCVRAFTRLSLHRLFSAPWRPQYVGSVDPPSPPLMPAHARGWHRFKVFMF